MRAADELGLVSRKSLWGQFWSSHQRFFKYLCIAAKVRCLVELAKKELEAGKVSATYPLPRPVPHSPPPFPVPHWLEITAEARSIPRTHPNVFSVHHSASLSGCSPPESLAPERSWTRTTGTWTDLSLLQSECMLLSLPVVQVSSLEEYKERKSSAPHHYLLCQVFPAALCFARAKYVFILILCSA